jgi:hypothetical protein
MKKPQNTDTPMERLSGSVERVTFHSEESGFCVLRTKVKGQRDMITVIGSAASITPGEYIECIGVWHNDRTHGLQFKASQLKVVPPSTLEGIEKYLGSGMNAFFASVEQQNNPELRGKPIAVIGSAKRTVITISSYEARAFGVKTGMNTWQAKQKCPHLIFVIGDNRKYTWTSSQIVKLMMQFTPLVEVFSIDEAFLDLTGSMGLFGSAERIAHLLKAEIKHHFGITWSRPWTRLMTATGIFQSRLGACWTARRLRKRGAMLYHRHGGLMGSGMLM